MGTGDKSLVKVKKIVERVIKDFGIDPDENTVEAVNGGFAWQIARGSADVMVSLIPGTEKAAGRFRVVSPIMKMEEGLSAEAAIRLLELNGSELPGVAFGLICGKITGQIVCLVTERSILELDKLEAKEMIGLVGYYADKYDDLLVNEFGGIRVCDLD